MEQERGEPAAGVATRKGRLTVFVAAAPGAGKTFAMLQEGQRLKSDGKDVAVGIVETYGRPKTIAEISDLDVMPRRVVTYKGLELQELDVDAIVRRHPDVVLIDELYRTNPPGARNPSRVEDVAEIRAAGIDVLTTMNIQHLESIKDVAEHIAGVSIRETIPDRLLEDADEVQLVDISPEALRKRMKHGNIYPSENIERALNGFFRPGNLAALRELALNWLANTEADRVSEEQHVTSENVMAAVREPSASQALVRRAVRMSRRYRGRCFAVTVLKNGESLSEELEEAMKLAQHLDAHFQVVVDNDPSRAIVDAVRANQVTQLIIGAPAGRFLDRMRGSFVDELLNQLRDVDLHVIARYEPSSAGAKKAEVVESTEVTQKPTLDPAGSEGGDRGYLRIYIGYAPGCGTTATMLREGQRRAERGTKVVVGAAATYGLKANEAALAGLTVIPPKSPADRPGGSSDMDLDAVLASGADVVCVDDLGYVNRDSSARYRFRYEEVEAIRRTGMKVVATVDLHDVASVAPRVLAETGVERDSRVPDWVLKESTELEVVDVPPAVLLERLSQPEGGIAEERAARLRNVYTLDVLGRLRELALRLVASHTDARLTAYMDMTGITEPWESMLRVMACVAPVPGLEPLVERAGRETERVEGTLVVVSVAPADSRKTAEEEAILDKYRALTEQVGGQFVALRSNQPAQALLDYAQRTHVTQLVLARGDTSGGTFDSSIKREIIKGASQIDVHVLREFTAPVPGGVEFTEDDAGI